MFQLSSVASIKMDWAPNVDKKVGGSLGERDHFTNLKPISREVQLLNVVV